MANWIGHFKTITAHKLRVMKYCFKVGLYRQGLAHDLSKYTPVEFCAGAKYYDGTRSPIELEKMELGYSAGWLHHKGRNKHHFEYWVDLNMQTKQYEPVPMPLNFIAEMFCDRVAACKIYKGKDYTDSSALEYYLRGHARSKMHPDTADTLESWLKMLADKGEAETFAHIKTSVKANKKSAK